MRLSEARLARKPKGREVLFDSKVRGLLARGGLRTGWVFAYQGPPKVSADGRPARPRTTLGAWSPVRGLGLSLSDARSRAIALAGKEEEKPTAKPSQTVRSLAEDFLDTRYSGNPTRRTKVEALLECHALPTIGGMAIAQVTRQDCMELVRSAKRERRVEGKGSVRRGGPAPAVALIRVLRQLFRHAVESGKLETLAHSPAELLAPRSFGLEAGEPRDRGLSAVELKTVFLHKEVDLPGLLEGRPGIEFGLSLSVRAAIILGPHLAVRPKALVGLRWDELDLEKATATIRGGRGAKLRHGKKARDFVVPLSETTMAVLRALEKSRGAFPWVFPSGSKAGHLSGDVLADAMLRLSARLELPGGPVRPHDARRTFTATAERLGISKLVVDRVLQHSLGKVGDTYFVGDDSETRRKAHSLVDEHWTAVRTGVPATVVNIGRAR